MFFFFFVLLALKMDSLDQLGHAILSGESGEIIVSSGDLDQQEDTIAYLWKIWQDIVLTLEISQEMETDKNLALEELKLRENGLPDDTQKVIEYIKENPYDYENIGTEISKLKEKQEKILWEQTDGNQREELLRITVQLKQFQYVLGAKKSTNEVYIVKKYSDDP